MNINDDTIQSLVQHEQSDSNDQIQYKMDFKRQNNRTDNSINDDHIQKMRTFESLNYQENENIVILSKVTKIKNQYEIQIKMFDWFLFFMIGATTGFVAFCIYISFGFLSEFRWKNAQEFVTDGNYIKAYLFFVGTSLLYCSISTLLVNFVSVHAGGSGIPDIKAYLNGVKLEDSLSFQTLIVKIIGVSLSVCGGLIAGIEGPMVHIGSIIAAVYSRQPKLKDYINLPWLIVFNNDLSQRDFISGGAAAGIASAFGAPVGGVLFMYIFMISQRFEEFSGYWNTELTQKVFFCASTSTFSLNFFISLYYNKYNFNSRGLLSFGLISSSYQLWEIPMFIIMGIVGGLVGGLFNHLNSKLQNFRRRKYINNQQLRILEVLILAIITSSIMFWTPAIISKCYKLSQKQQIDTQYIQYNCAKGYYNDLATLSFTQSEFSIQTLVHSIEQFSYTSLIIYFLQLYIFAIITFGSAVPSGIFIPCILIGCVYGRIFGQFIQNNIDQTIQPSAYAFLGAVSMLGGSTRMLISLTVIMLEITGDKQYLIPIMITLNIAIWTGDYFNLSLQDQYVKLKSFPFLQSLPHPGMELLQAHNLMTKNVITFREKEQIQIIYHVLKNTKHNGFPIVDHQKKLKGLILRNQLILMLQNVKKVAISGDSFKQMSHDQMIALMETSEFINSIQSNTIDIDLQVNPFEIKSLEKNILDLTYQMNPAVYTVQENCTISRIFRLFKGLQIRHLFVINIQNEVIGIITRKDLMTDVRKDLMTDFRKDI